MAYLRSVFLQPNKAVFDVAALPVEDFAASMGLASVPKLRFLKKVGVCGVRAGWLGVACMRGVRH